MPEICRLCVCVIINKCSFQLIFQRNWQWWYIIIINSDEEIGLLCCNWKHLCWKLMCWCIDHYEWARVLCLKIDFATFMVRVCLVCLAGFGCSPMLTASWSHRWELDVRCGPKVDQRLLERSWTRGAAPYLTPPTPQGNDLTCMKRHSSWSEHFSVKVVGQGKS